VSDSRRWDEQVLGIAAGPDGTATEPATSPDDTAVAAAGGEDAVAELAALPYCFGPAFFLSHLRRYVRDACPSPGEGLPQVEVHLGDGRSLMLCHVVLVTPQWVALSVFDEGHGRHGAMRTDLVPYGLITRISISRGADGGSAIGFDVDRRPNQADAAGVAD